MTIATTEAVTAEYEELCRYAPKSGPAIRGVIDRIGDKWSLLVIVTLAGGPMRHGELRRQVIGVSQRMLTLTLRQLERDGLITRTIHPEIPPRVEYALTDLGTTLIPPALSIAHWAIANYATIEKSRVEFDSGAARRGAPLPGD